MLNFIRFAKTKMLMQKLAKKHKSTKQKNSRIYETKMLMQKQREIK